jgi:pimeloyl-ACP methyl ester carboxylesterase
MAITEALGERRTVTVPAGTIEYRERGSGPPIVFAHGVAVNGDLWRNVAPELADSYRCIVPDLPLGGHSHALREDADLTLPGVANVVADFIEALDLADVVLVSNDTGGAVAQAVAAHRPERIGRLVLTSCDAFDHFPPRAIAYLKPTAFAPGGMWLAAQSMRFKGIQRLPIAFGWATLDPIEPRIMESYVTPVRTNRGVRRDFMRFMRAVHRRYTHEAASKLPGFDRPALVAWADDDKFFPREDGERLAQILPDARFEIVPRSRTFIPEDNPKALLGLLRNFLGAKEVAR